MESGDDDEAEDETFKLGREELEAEKEDDDDDVITSAPTPRRKSMRKAQTPVTSTPMSRRTTGSKPFARAVSPRSPEKFMSKDVRERFHFFRMKGFIVERVMGKNFDDVGMTGFLKEKGLLFSVSYPSSFFPFLVSEFLFYANLLQSIQDPRSETFEKVTIRGKTISFSPAMINSFLQTPSLQTVPPMALKNEISNTISNGLDPIWHNQYKCTMLSSLCGFLFKIATLNWKPTSNRNTIAHTDLIYRIFKGIDFNLGEVVCVCIVQFAEKELPLDLPFPCLISGLCLKQGVDIIQSARLWENIEPFGIQPILECTKCTIDLSVVFPDDPVVEIHDEEEDDLANVGDDVIASPMPQIDPAVIYYEEIKFLEKAMMYARVHFKEMSNRRNKLLAARASISDKKGGASSSQVFEDISQDFRWELLQKTREEMDKSREEMDKSL